MNKVFSQNFFLKEHFIAVIGVLLCLYFSYHAISGQRSLLTLYTVQKSIEKNVAKRDIVTTKRQSIEHKVRAMRPGQVNKDLLEERVRIVLGYTRPDEVVILSN